MKKSNFIVIPVMAATLALFGCSAEQSADSAPVIESEDTIECLVRQDVDLLDNVRALDDRDGDLTASMNISLDGVTVNNGVAFFTDTGDYTAVFSVTDSAGHTAVKNVNIKVHERDVYRAFRIADGSNGFTFDAPDDGTVVGKVTDGAYSIKATGVASDSAVALSRAFESDETFDGEVVYHLNSSVAGSATVTVNGVNTAVEITSGDCTVRAPASGGDITSSLDLKGLASDYEVKVKSAELCTDESNYEELCGDEFVFDDGTVTVDYNRANIREIRSGVAEDKKSGYMTVVTGSNDRQPYYAKMFIHTGALLKAGYKYRVSFDAAAEHAQDFEVTFNARRAEKKASDRDEALYGLHINEGEAQTFACETDIVPNTDRGELWIQISFGKVPSDIDSNTLTVSDISVKAVKAGAYGFGGHGEFDSKFDENQGAKGDLTVRDGKLIYHAEKFSTTDWANELSSRMFTVENTGGSYVVSFTAKATNPTSVVFVIPTFGGWDPTLTWQRFTIGTEEREYRFRLSGVEDKGPYYLLFQFGCSANSVLPDTTVEISNVNIEVKSDFEN